jgi:FkbM family methyltransferase
MNNLNIFSSPLKLLDVGASYFIPDTWKIPSLVLNTTIILVDPNGNNLTYAKDLKCQTFCIASAVAEQSGWRTLYLANTDSGSSLYPPLARVKFDKVDNDPYFYPLRLKNIQVSTLQHELNRIDLHQIDAIKLDTQGSELEIIKGLDHDRLKDVQLIEIEVSLENPPFYQGATKLREVLAYLEPLGFSLINIRLSRSKKIIKYDLPIPNECDALLFRSRSTFDQDSNDKNLLIRRLALLNLYYIYSAADTELIFMEKSDLFSSEELMLIRNSQLQLRQFQDEILSNGGLSLWHRDSA